MELLLILSQAYDWMVPHSQPIAHEGFGCADPSKTMPEPGERGTIPPVLLVVLSITACLP